MTSMLRTQNICPDFRRYNTFASKLKTMDSNSLGATPVVLINPAARSSLNQLTLCSNGTWMQEFATRTSQMSQPGPLDDLKVSLPVVGGFEEGGRSRS